jgi:hypothetical protein
MTSNDIDLAFCDKAAFLALSDSSQLGGKHVSVSRILETRGFEFNDSYILGRDKFGCIVHKDRNPVEAAVPSDLNSREQRYRAAVLAAVLLTEGVGIPASGKARYLSHDEFNRVKFPMFYEIAERMLVSEFSSRELRLLGNPRSHGKTVSKLAVKFEVPSEVIIRRFEFLSNGHQVEPVSVNGNVKPVLSADENTKNFVDQLARISNV